MAEADCIAELGHIAGAADCIAEPGRIGAGVGAENIVGNNLVARRKIGRMIAEPPADSFGVGLAAKCCGRFPDRLEPAEHLGKYLSRER